MLRFYLSVSVLISWIRIRILNTDPRGRWTRIRILRNTAAPSNQFPHPPIFWPFSYRSDCRWPPGQSRRGSRPQGRRAGSWPARTWRAGRSAVWSHPPDTPGSSRPGWAAGGAAGPRCLSRGRQPPPPTVCRLQSETKTIIFLRNKKCIPYVLKPIGKESRPPSPHLYYYYLDCHNNASLAIKKTEHYR